MPAISEQDMIELRKAGATIGAKLAADGGRSTKQAQSLLDGLSTEDRSAIRNALIGAGVGAASLGAYSSYKGQSTGDTMINALLGALTGAAAGGGGTLAKNYLTGASRLPGETAAYNDRSLKDQTSDAVIRSTLGNAGLLAGGAVGAAGSQLVAKDWPGARMSSRLAADAVLPHVPGFKGWWTGLDNKDNLARIMDTVPKHPDRASILSEIAGASDAAALKNVREFRGLTGMQGAKGLGKLTLGALLGAGTGSLVQRYLEGRNR